MGAICGNSTVRVSVSRQLFSSVIDFPFSYVTGAHEELPLLLNSVKIGGKSTATTGATAGLRLANDVSVHGSQRVRETEVSSICLWNQKSRVLDATGTGLLPGLPYVRRVPLALTESAAYQQSRQKSSLCFRGLGVLCTFCCCRPVRA